MKRFPTAKGLAALFVSSFMLGTSACTVAPNGNNSAATGNTGAPAANSNTNANLSSAGAVNADELTARERQVWDALKNKNHEAFGKMLASDFVYVSTDGVSDKAGTLEGLKNFAPTEITLSDWKTVTLDADAAVVTYTVDAKGTSGGQPLPPGALRASTAWVKRGAEWLAVYHQDSPVEEATANATPAAETSKPSGGTANANSANANSANANSASTGAPATHTGANEGDAAAADPIVKEKLLWEALKRKDWETFAAGLAEDQLEVEPTGVYDKAGTLAAVKTYNFTNLSLSDFKGHTIDRDATLVTYTVKGPGPDGKPMEERASSIWVNRGGKWLAVFHQGTPVTPMPAR